MQHTHVHTKALNYAHTQEEEEVAEEEEEEVITVVWAAHLRPGNLYLSHWFGFRQ